MSPFSFLSSFALPSFSSVNSYLPNLSLPENIQQKLVSFVLRRTLGRFVQHEGLLGDKVETQVATGRIAFGRLELDPNAINTYFPPGLPLTFLHGHIASADIQLPIPNLLSAPLSINISEIHVSLGLRETSEDEDGEPSVDLGRSVLAVTEDFMAESLSQRDIQDLSTSIAFASDTQEDTNAGESIYQTPGGFPVPITGRSPANPPSMSILASAVENILSRLQVQVEKVIITLNLPSEATPVEDLEESENSSVDLGPATVAEAIEIRLERISYGLDGNNEDEGVRKLRIPNVGVWMVTKSLKRVDALEESVSSIAPGLSTGGSRGSPRMSSSATLAQSTSMYESAIGSTHTVTGLEENLDPFGPPQRSGSEAGDSYQQEDHGTQSHCICSLGQSGVEVTLRESRDMLASATLHLEAGDTRLAVSDGDVRTLAMLISAWALRTPFPSKITTAKPSSNPNKAIDVEWAIASVRIMMYAGTPDQQGLILKDGNDAIWTLPQQMGLELFLGSLTGLISGDASRTNMNDLALLWHRSADAITTAKPATLVSLLPHGQQNASPTEDLDDEVPGQATKYHPRYSSNRPVEDTSSTVRKSLAISMDQGSATISVPGIEISVDLSTVDDMLPFLRRLSGTLASASLSNARKEASPRPSGGLSEFKHQVTCEYVRLHASLPLQDRYYELESYEGDVARRIVTEVLGLSVDADGTQPSPSLSFDTATIYFGLTTELEIPAVCTISSTRMGGSSVEASTRPRIRMEQNDGLDPCWRGQLPVVYLWLSRSAWAGLQYLADDVGTWLDSAMHGDDNSTRDNIKLVSSRFFGPASIVAPLEISLDQLKGLRNRILHINVDSIFVSIKTASHHVCLNAAGTILQIDSLKGKEYGTVVKLDCAALNSSVDRPGSATTHLIQELPKLADSTNSRPATSINLATILMAQPPSKQTSIDLSLTSSTLWTAGREAWMEEIAETLRAPSDVFVDVDPSDVTKIAVTLDEVALIYRRAEGGALCFDIGQFRIRTVRRRHALDQEFTLKSDEIRLHAADLESKTEAYCAIAKILNLRAKLSSQHISEQILLELSRMDTTVHGCTDSLRTAVDHLKAMATAFQSKSSTTPKEPDRSQTKRRSGERSFNGRDLGIVERAFTPDAVKPTEGDFLDDDLPTHQRYLTLSRKGNLGSASRDEVKAIDGIEIECVEDFQLDCDHFEEVAALLTDSLPATQRYALRIEAENCNLKFELFDGYDWASTRRDIEVERKAMRRHLQRIRQLLTAGQEPPKDFSQLSGFVFNSVHLGLPEEAEYTSPAELASAIDLSLESLGDDLEDEDQTWQEFENDRPATQGAAFKPATSLRRSQNAGIEFKLLGIQVQYVKPLFPNMAGYDASLDLSVETLEILDHLPTSTWKTFLRTKPVERPGYKASKHEPSTSRCQIRWFGSSQNEGSEASVKLNILPVKMHVDQDAIDFIKRFMSFSSRSDTHELPQTPETLPAPAQFIQRAEVSPVEIRLDYKPKRINMNSLRKGHLGELINLFHFEDSKVVLRHATVRGVSGWGAVYGALMQIWSPDIRANQMSDLVGGAAPVRSLIRVGEGVANLVLLPIEQYQKDGRLVKGLQRGGKSFAKTTTLEAIKLTSKLATGTQVILEKAEAALRGSNSSPVEVIDNGSDSRQKHSRYADQPTGAREGISQAYSALAHDLGSAAQTILAIPMEVHENAGGGEATGRTVIRAVPLAVVQTMMGVTNASRKTLQGIRNQLDSQVQQQLQEKYK